jgi:hypothetical protein
LDRFKPGVSLGTIEPYLPEEVAAVEGGDRAGELGPRRRTGLVIVFEIDSVEQATRPADAFPRPKAGFLEWFLSR